MRLMPDSQIHYSEDEMQENVADYLSMRTFLSSEPYHERRIIPKIYREVRIPKIGRISDIILYITDRKIINIECKRENYGVVFEQAKDHLKWADYSYICLPSETYLPAYILDKMINLGIGLLFWHPDYFVEVLQSGYNKDKDKSIREYVIAELKKRDSYIKAINQNNNQLSFHAY